MRRLIECISAILNALRVKKESVLVLNSRFIRDVLRVLQQEGFITDFEVINSRSISVKLKYYRRLPVIRSLKFISTGSHSIYTKASIGIPRNWTLRILSTNKGVMSHPKAVEAGIGGKVIMEVF